MSFLNRQRRRPTLRRVSMTHYVLWTICIASSLVYVYFTLHFVTRQQQQRTNNRIDFMKQQPDKQGRRVSFSEQQEILLSDTTKNKQRRVQTSTEDGDDDDGQGKHRPYPFKVTSQCPNHDRVAAIDTIRHHRTTTRSRDRIISIRGERHSGTKLLRTLLNRNSHDIQDLNKKLVNVNMTMDTMYGWKHGYFHQDFVPHPNDVFLIIVRDVFSWALSMYRDPYNMIFLDNMTEFGPFLMGSYRSQNCEAPHFMKKCNFPMEEAENIIQLRTAKYRNWTGYPHLQHSLVKYEDVASDQIGVITGFLEKHGISHGDSRFFQRADTYIGFQGEGHKVYQPVVQREQYLGHYTVDEIRFVLRNLDMTFERSVLNYTYDDIESYIRERLDGKKPYLGAPTLLEAKYERETLKSNPFD